MRGRILVQRCKSRNCRTLRDIYFASPGSYLAQNADLQRAKLAVGDDQEVAAAARRIEHAEIMLGDGGHGVTFNVTLPFMIKGFASKTLRRAFEDGDYRRINPQWRARVELLLDALDAAEKVEDLNLLTLGTHPLKGNRKGEWGMTVTKNWRITFRFEAGDADKVNLEDYH